MGLWRKRKEAFKNKSFNRQDIKKMIRKEEKFRNKYGSYNSISSNIKKT